MKGNKWRIEKEEERGGEDQSQKRKSKGQKCQKDIQYKQKYQSNQIINFFAAHILLIYLSYLTPQSFSHRLSHPLIQFISITYSICLILLFNLSHPIIQFISSYHSICLILLFNLSQSLIQFVSSSYSICLILLSKYMHK